MNIYRQLAENVWNPRMSSGADIQRQLDLMDQFQSSAPTSNIGYAMGNTPQGYEPSYGREGVGGYEGGEGYGQPGNAALADNPYGLALMGYQLGLPNAAMSAIFGKEGLQAAQDAFPSPQTTVGKGLTGYGIPMGANYLGLPSWGVNMATRGFLNPLSAALEGLLGYGKNPGYTSFSPQSGYGPSSGYSPGGGYDPSAGVNTGSGYATPGGYDPSAEFSGPTGYGSSSGYSPGGGYDPSGGFTGGMDLGGLDLGGLGLNGFGGWD